MRVRREPHVALKRTGEVANLDVKIGEIGGSHLAGISYRPLFSAKLPETAPSLLVVPSDHVTETSGTGLVHCAPAHGQEDYSLFRSLEMISSSSTNSVVCHVDSLGCFTTDVAETVGEDAAAALAGKEVLGDGGKVMVGLLRELGVLQKVQRIKHRYPYDWKTAKPIIVT